MIREFEIWHQNSNPITFDPLLSQHLTPFGITYFLANRRIKYNLIWILRSDLESSHHLASLMTPFNMIFTFWIFWPPIYTTITYIIMSIKCPYYVDTLAHFWGFHFIIHITESPIMIMYFMPVKHNVLKLWWRWLVFS